MTLAERRPRHNCPPLPRLWLVTDRDRLPDPVPAAARLPAGSGVILRHHDDPGRAALARRLAGLCRMKRLLLLVANDWRLAAAIGADGVHLAEGLARHTVLAPTLGWRRRHGKCLSVAAHTLGAARHAQKLDADFCLLSQAFASRSHPGVHPWGPVRFALAARRAGVPVIALGGMNRRSWQRLPTGCAHGWAAIDGLR